MSVSTKECLASSPITYSAVNNSIFYLNFLLSMHVLQYNVFVYLCKLLIPHNYDNNVYVHISCCISFSLLSESGSELSAGSIGGSKSGKKGA